MRPAPLFLTLCLNFFMPQSARAQEGSRVDHFIDFRARPGALWGHTFILYGRVDERGQPIELHRAGLYPDDGRPGLILGTFVRCAPLFARCLTIFPRHPARSTAGRSARRSTCDSRQWWPICEPTTTTGT